MAPKEPQTLEERMYAAELEQENHEKEFNRFRDAIMKVEETAESAKQLAVQANTAIAGLPSKVMEEIKKSNGSRRLEFRDWLGLFVAVVACAAAFMR